MIDLASMGEHQTAVGLLRAHAGELVDDWRSACVADVVRSHGDGTTDGDGYTVAQVHALIATAGPAVLAALATVLDDPEQAEGPESPLDAAAGPLVDNSVTLATPVRQLTLLRQVLHRHAAERLPAPLAARAEHEVSGAVDALLEVCTVRAAERLEQAAFVDPLTGLLNRRALDRDLPRELAVAERHGRRVSLVMSDVDGLKRINDVGGHGDGDGALCRLAGALRSGLRQGDTAYRVGGDEFVVLLPEMSQEDVAQLMRRVQAGDAPAFSWGAATFPDEVANRPSLLDLADRRLFAHRRAARTPVPLPGSLRPATAREAGPRARVRGRRLTVLPSFLAGILLGGAGLASAATGNLPAPVQNVAHAMLAKVGVPVPSSDEAPEHDAGDVGARRRAEKPTPGAGTNASTPPDAGAGPTPAPVKPEGRLQPAGGGKPANPGPSAPTGSGNPPDGVTPGNGARPVAPGGPTRQEGPEKRPDDERAPNPPASGGGSSGAPVPSSTEGTAPSPVKESTHASEGKSVGGDSADGVIPEPQ